MGTYRGHEIAQDATGAWVYADTGQLVSEAPDRPCGHCGLANTADGHDGCLGTLAGVMNACCGHGREDSAYIQRLDGSVISGPQAWEMFYQRLWRR